MSNAEIPLDGLTVVEKLNLMERLWVDLSRTPTDIPSPDWHAGVLAERLKAAEDGDVEFVDWAEAKKRLQQRFE